MFEPKKSIKETGLGFFYIYQVISSSGALRAGTSKVGGLGSLGLFNLIKFL